MKFVGPQSVTRRTNLAYDSPNIYSKNVLGRQATYLLVPFDFYLSWKIRFYVLWPEFRVFLVRNAMLIFVVFWASEIIFLRKFLEYRCRPKTMFRTRFLELDLPRCWPHGMPTLCCFYSLTLLHTVVCLIHKLTPILLANNELWR